MILLNRRRGTFSSGIRTLVKFSTFCLKKYACNRNATWKEEICLDFAQQISNRFVLLKTGSVERPWGTFVVKTAFIVFLLFVVVFNNNLKWGKSRTKQIWMIGGNYRLCLFKKTCNEIIVYGHLHVFRHVEGSLGKNDKIENLMKVGKLSIKNTFLFLKGREEKAWGHVFFESWERQNRCELRQLPVSYVWLFQLMPP